MRHYQIPILCCINILVVISQSKADCSSFTYSGKCEAKIIFLTLNSPLTIQSCQGNLVEESQLIKSIFPFVQAQKYLTKHFSYLNCLAITEDRITVLSV